jgi:hypothetical protein
MKNLQEILIFNFILDLVIIETKAGQINEQSCRTKSRRSLIQNFFDNGGYAHQFSAKREMQVH